MSPKRDEREARERARIRKGPVDGPTNGGDKEPIFGPAAPVHARSGTQIQIRVKWLGGLAGDKPISFTVPGGASVAVAIDRETDDALYVTVPPLAPFGSGGPLELIPSSDTPLSTPFVIDEPQGPSISEVSPRVVPGGRLTIKGTGFGRKVDLGVRSVIRFESNPAQFRADGWASSEIAITLPAIPELQQPGQKTVYVLTPWGTASATFQVPAKPTLADVQPSGTLAPDTLFTITGTELDEVAVKIADADAEVLSRGATSLVARVPGLARLGASGAQTLRVSNPSGSATKTVTVDRSSITSWLRLEAHSRNEDLEEGLRVGLEARVHDPLWLLARQWQLGEFQGEDAGSPVEARLEVEAAPLQRIRPSRTGDSQALPPAVPLEAIVEGERAFGAEGGRSPWTLRLAAEAGMHFLRLLDGAFNQPGKVKQYRERYLAFAPLSAPPGDSPVDPAGARLIGLASGRVPDGGRLFTELRTALPKSRGGTGKLPREPKFEPPDEEALIGLAVSFLDWCEALISRPGGGPAWDRARMEYGFAISAETSDGELVLEAPGHRGGTVDWHSFDVAGGSLRPSDAKPSPQTTKVSSRVVPVPVSYPGMPAPRWWELEHARVDFGGIDAGPTDLARLMLIEFATVYSNDWFLAPIGGVPAGAVCTVRSLTVIDSFGVQTPVKPFSASPDAAGWRMFDLSTRGAAETGRLLLPAAPAAVTDAEPLEEVIFLRDEIANLGWGVECRVEGRAGTAINRAETHRRVPSVITDSANGQAKDGLAYRLATRVPNYWIALVPHEDEVGAHWLRRGALAGDARPQAVGRVLEPELQQLAIRDEEIPREGSIVTRGYRYARGPDGSTHLWIGRRRQPGRGEGSSGLRFDLVERRS